MDRIVALSARESGPGLSADAAERFDRLFRLYHSRVLAYATTRARRLEDADDIAGEAWLRAGLSLSQLKADDAHAFGWLRTIVTRAAVDHYRPKRATEQPRNWMDVLSSAVLPFSPSAEDEALCLLGLGLRTSLGDRPPLPLRPTPHERDGRQPVPQPARPHSCSDDRDLPIPRTPATPPRLGAVLASVG